VKARDGATRSLRETVLAGAFFLGYTILATWPQAADLSGSLADLWDAKLSAWIFHWDYAQTVRDPLNLFQAPLLHPARYVLAFSENMYGAAVFGFPLLAGGASLITNYNVLLLLGMFLSALSAWALARYVTGDPLASLAAGVVYAFLPYKLAQLPHVHMEWGAFLCLVFLFLLRYLDEGRRRDAVLLAVAFAWNAYAVIQYAFFTGFLVVTVLVLEAIQSEAARRRLPAALLAMAIGGFAFLPFAIPYVKASKLYGMRRTVGEMTYFSAKPSYFLSAGDRNRFWGPVTQKFRGHEGDFFPGIVAIGLAGVAVLQSRRRETRAPESRVALSAWRLRVARVCDGLIPLLAVVWVAARLKPGLRLGPVSVGDAGRVLVFLTLVVLLRLAFAFPKRLRDASLRDASLVDASLVDWLRRPPLDRRVLLLVAVGAVGVLVCLGGHTPYYRFLFTTFGSLFRAIRVAARGVVLFQVALAVLAAWGLSVVTRGRALRSRILATAAVLLLMTVEYRAFPLKLDRYDSGAVAVYEWLRGTELGDEGAVVELPLGFPYDCEHTFRQAEHGHPLVNGHSSFAPRAYEELYALTHQRPIPNVVWEKLERLGGRILILHTDVRNQTARELIDTLRFVRRGIQDGRIEPVASFPHAGATDVVLRPAGMTAALPPLPPGSAERALDALRVADAAIAPPFARIDFPAPVAVGEWRGGWALDDSGIAEIRIASELGPAGSALLHMHHPGMAAAFPDYEEAAGDRAGFGFAVPALPPGPHTLTLTIVANDGGTTVLTRPIVITGKTSPP
jgi:hypothetical protein